MTDMFAFCPELEEITLFINEAKNINLDNFLYNTPKLSKFTTIHEDYVVIQPSSMLHTFENTGLTDVPFELNMTLLTPESCNAAFKNSSVENIRFTSNSIPAGLWAFTNVGSTAGTMGDCSNWNVATINSVISAFQDLRNTNKDGIVYFPKIWESKLGTSVANMVQRFLNEKQWRCVFI